MSTVQCLGMKAIRLYCPRLDKYEGTKSSLVKFPQEFLTSVNVFWDWVSRWVPRGSDSSKSGSQVLLSTHPSWTRCALQPLYPRRDFPSNCQSSVGRLSVNLRESPHCHIVQNQSCHWAHLAFQISMPFQCQSQQLAIRRLSVCLYVTSGVLATLEHVVSNNMER